ncbi:rCG59151 [Rattus norvegicus]|uniref:RCG59151 n=1 Tax=Rattus norvegicus TaxID=10116 RepID=A6KIV4_RAT|nr:rCG59151 [Rattus norvegicus]
MPTSPKESGVSCVPHGTRGKEMIKAVRFPGSSWCLRWVLIWEESEERLGPVAICQRPESVWAADDMGGGGLAARALGVHIPSGCRSVSPSVLCGGLPGNTCMFIKKRSSSFRRRSFRFFHTSEELHLSKVHTFLFQTPFKKIVVFPVFEHCKLTGIGEKHHH